MSRYNITSLSTDDQGIVVDSEHETTIRLDITRELEPQIITELKGLNLIEDTETITMEGDGLSSFFVFVDGKLSFEVDEEE